MGPYCVLLVAVAVVYVVIAACRVGRDSFSFEEAESSS